MAGPVLGSYYIFKYIGGRAYDPDLCEGEGMYIGDKVGMNVFATILPNRTANMNHSIQDIILTYTTLDYQPIRFPRDKVIMTSDTHYLLMKYVRSAEYKIPINTGRLSPTQYILPETLIQQA